MPGGKCRKCGCDSFSMDIFQCGANILNWGVASAARIMGGGDKDESAALKKCGCGHHYNYHEWNNLLNNIKKIWINDII